MGIVSFLGAAAVATAVSFGSAADFYSSIRSRVVSIVPDIRLAQNVLPGSANSIRCEAYLTARDRRSQINLRSEPSITSRPVGYGLVGDRVSILDQTLGPDSFTWYKVQFPQSLAQGWIRGDLMQMAGSTCTGNSAQDPNPEAGLELGRSSSPPSLGLDNPEESDVAIARRTFSDQEIDYFLEVALGSEYGSSSANLRRWENNIRLKIMFPDPSVSRATRQQVTESVEQVVVDINSLIAEASAGSDRPPVQVEIVDSNPNVEFYFVRAEDFERYDPNARRDQLGHVWTWWSNNVINRSRILVATNYLTSTERDHVIREEITQSLGILKDSWTYPNSIFYQGWTSTRRYDPLDEAVIRILYNPSMTPGMTAEEVRERLRQL